MPQITMGRHQCCIKECEIFAEVVLSIRHDGARTYVFTKKEFHEFVDDFVTQSERVLGRD